MTDGAIVGTFRRRHWSDFVGVLCYTVLAINIALGSRELGLLILPSLVHELLVAAAFILRGPARRISVGSMPCTAELRSIWMTQSLMVGM